MSYFTDTDERYYIKGKTYSRDEYAALAASITSGDLGPATPDTNPATLPTSPIAGKSFGISTTGVYANFKDAANNPITVPVAPDGYTFIGGRLYFNGSYWQSTPVYVPVPVPSNKIQPWVPQAYNAADQVNTLGNDYVANRNVLATDVPGTSSGWDLRLPAYNNRISNVESALTPVLLPKIITNQYGINPVVSSGTAFTNNAATIGKALTASTLSKLVLYFGAAGSFNLLVITQGAGNSFTINQTIALTAVVGTNTFLPAQFGSINLAANQWIAIQVTTGNASVFYTTAGVATQNYFVTGVATTTQNWNSTTSAKYAGYFETAETHANQFSVDKEYLSAAVQASLANADLVPDQEEAIAENTASLAAIAKVSDIIASTGLITQLGNFPTFTGTPTANSPLRATMGRVTVNSILTKVVIRASAVGAFNLIIYNKTGTVTFTEVDVIPLNFSIVGDNTFTAADFGLINLTAGQYVGAQMVAGAGNGSSYYSSATGVDSYFNTSTSTAATLNFNQTAVNKYFGYFEIGTPLVLVPEANLSPSVQTKLNNPQLVLNPRRPALVYDAGFNSTVAPTDWLVSSGWSWTANGLLSPVGASNWTQVAQQNNPGGPSNEESIRRFRFVPQATGIKFAAGTYCTSSYGGTSNKSTLFSISDSENLIKFYNLGNNSWPSEPTVFSSAPLLPLVAGKHYLIEMKRYRRTNTVTVYDVTTGNVMGTLTNDYLLSTDNLNTGSQVGSFIIFNQIGQTAFTRVSVSHACYNPRLFAMGDSISEGLTVPLTARWLQMVFNDLKGSAALNAISGSQMKEIPQKLMYDIPAMKPQWILSYYNHNDGDGAGSNVTTIYNQLMAYCQTNGINLAICCLAPTTTTQYTAFNAYILSLPGWVRKVRMDLALTVNNDGVTWNTAVYNDVHHPNAAGNLLEYARIKMDIPELFY